MLRNFLCLSFIFNNPLSFNKNIMKILSLLTLLLLYTNLFSNASDIKSKDEEVSIKAYVIDRETKKPVPYVEIGFLNLEKGVISDRNGFFELNVKKSDLDENDFLLFQSAGYFPVKMKLSLVKEHFSKHQFLFLTKKDKSNSSFEFESSQKVYDTKRPEIVDYPRFWTTNSTNGKEIVTSLANLEMNTRKPLMYYLEFKNADSLKLKLKFYDGLSEERFQDKGYKEVYQNVKASGWQTIQLDSIKLNSFEDLHIGIQVVDSFDKDFILKIGLSEDFVGFQKVAAHAKLDELPFFGVDFKVLPQLKYDINEDPAADKNEKIISGIVTRDGKPLNKATIKVNNSLEEVQSNSDGSFSIKADREDNLVFSHFSAPNKEVTITDDGFLQVEMSKRYIDLDTVKISKRKQTDKLSFPEVDTPFGKIKKRTSGYATYTKNIDELNKAALSFGELIDGKFPGLQVSRGMGEADQFTLRGGVTSMRDELDGRNQDIQNIQRGALVIVDGIPDAMNGSMLDVNNIMSVSVLSGILAGSRYGTLGKNGVILVTTKAGSYVDKASDRKQMEDLIFNKTFTQETSKAIKLDDLQVFDFNSSPDDKLAIGKYNKQNVPFFIESFKHYYDKGEKELAINALDTLESLLETNVKALKSLAFTYEEYDLFDKALRIRKKIGSLQPYSIQSYLDLAQSYTNSKKYNKASEIYTSIIENKIPGLTLDESSIELAEIKLKHLLTKHKMNLDLKHIDERYYRVAQTFDVFVEIDWNDVNSSFDIQYINSKNKYLSSSHNVVSDFDRLNFENETGYHTEFFMLRNQSDVDDMKISLKGSDENLSNDNPSYVRFTIYRNYGSKDENREYKVINLNKLNSRSIDITSFKSNQI